MSAETNEAPKRAEPTYAWIDRLTAKIVALQEANRALLSERDAAAARAEAAEARCDLFDTQAAAAKVTAAKAEADLDAAVQAEREACATQLDMMRKAHNDALIGQPHIPDTSIAYGNGAAAIRARGPTPALDAALAQARREGARDAREQIAKVFEDNDMLSTASEIRALPISAAAGEGAPRGE